MYIWIYIYIYIYIHVYICIHVHIYLCIHIYIHTYIYTVERPFYFVSTSLFVRDAYKNDIGEVHMNWHLWRRRSNLSNTHSHSRFWSYTGTISCLFVRSLALSLSIVPVLSLFPSLSSPNLPLWCAHVLCVSRLLFVSRAHARVVCTLSMKRGIVQDKGSRV